MYDYSKLDGIGIDECDLILKKYGAIYKLCLNRGIDTLGELVRKYDNGEIIIHNFKANEEMAGFIDLIKYYYFGICFPEDSILFDNIVYIDQKKLDDYFGIKVTKFDSNKFINPLIRLGFSMNEVRAILRFVEKKEKSMMIIVALIMYKDVKKKWIPSKYKGCLEIFEKKLDIILKYFKENYVDNDSELLKSICDKTDFNSKAILSLKK